MQHEKLVVNEIGDKIKIRISFWVDNNRPFYDIVIYVCKKGKRKFYCINYGDDYEYRRLSMPERREFMLQKYIKIVPIEFINQAKKEMYDLLKP